MGTKKKLVFPLPVDVKNVNYLSGTLWSIYNSLSKQFDLIPIGPLRHDKSKVQMVLNRLKNKYKLFPWRFATMHSWKTVNSFAKQIEHELNDVEYDAIFSVSTLYTGAITTNKPTFAFTDFSFYNAIDYYDFGKDLFPASKNEALEVDKYCFENHTHVFLASEWAKQSTEEAYYLSPDKIIAVGRGANLTSGKSDDEIDGLIDVRTKTTLKTLLFVGVDWSRKGGNEAFEIVNALMKHGFNVELKIVGCNPPPAIAKCKFVTVYPFLNRNNPSELQLLRKLFEEAWAFILPTKAEAMGIVFAEASSFALPSIAYDTGGVSTAIDHDKTGILFNPDATIEQMTLQVQNMLIDENKYIELSRNAYFKYKNELNWDTIIDKVSQIILPKI